MRLNKAHLSVHVPGSVSDFRVKVPSRVGSKLSLTEDKNFRLEAGSDGVGEKLPPGIHPSALSEASI